MLRLPALPQSSSSPMQYNTFWISKFPALLFQFLQGVSNEKRKETKAIDAQSNSKKRVMMKILHLFSLSLTHRERERETERETEI